MKFIIPKKVRKASKLTRKNLVERCLKLTEENGELAAEIFKFKGLKKTNLTKSQIQENMMEEAIDCLIMGMDLVVHLGMTDKQIQLYLDKKIDKWLDNMKKKK